MRSLVLLLFVTLVPLVASAETRFVEVEVTLRTGQGTDFGIVRMIRSGTPVEVLEQDQQTGYSRVRMPGGTEGWILARYLTQSPIGAEELVAARQRIDQLSRENRELTEERNRYMGEADTLAEELARLKDLSSNAIALEDANRTLRTTLNRNQERIANLETDNDRLRSTVTRDWFLAGAGVLVGGVLIGVILPRLRWRRRRSRWSDL
jgi:SH3 domain protein